MTCNHKAYYSDNEGRALSYDGQEDYKIGLEAPINMDKFDKYINKLSIKFSGYSNSMCFLVNKFRWKQY